MGLLDQQPKEFHEHLLLDSTVTEMGPLDTSVISIPVDEKLLAKIRSRDENPEFVTVEVKSGWSGNKRNWRPEILERVAETVNLKKPVGYLGHIPDNDRGTALPPPQTLWVGAKTSREGDKTVLYIKGYNRTKDVRDYVDLGMIDAVSISGDATLRPVRGGYDVIDFTLESIDWARKGKNGMASRVISITSEMEGGNDGVDGKDIAAISEAELRQYNSTLVELLESKSGTPLKEKVTEMEATIEKQKGFSDLVQEIADRFKVEPDKIMENLDELLNKMKGAKASEVKNYITKVIEDKVKTARGQKLVTRLVGEMEDITELTDDSKKEIEKRVTDALEGDDDIKAIVGEMKDEKGSSGNSGGLLLGGKSKSVEARIDNENLVISKVPFNG